MNFLVNLACRIFIMEITYLYNSALSHSHLFRFADNYFFRGQRSVAMDIVLRAIRGACNKVFVEVSVGKLFLSAREGET